MASDFVLVLHALFPFYAISVMARVDAHLVASGRKVGCNFFIDRVYVFGFVGCALGF